MEKKGHTDCSPARLLILTLAVVFGLSSKPIYGQEIGRDTGYSLLLKRLPELRGRSVYVFLYRLASSSTTSVPPVMKEWKAVQKIIRPNESIVFVFNNQGGIPDSDLKTYVHNNFKLDSTAIDGVHFLIDDSLYFALKGGGSLGQLHYYYDGELLYNRSCKWHNIDQESLPHNKVYVSGAMDSIVIKKEHGIILKENDILIPAGNRLYIYADNENKLFQLSKDGRLSTRFDFGGLSAAQLFCQYFANDSIACGFAKAHEYLPVQTGRQVVKPFVFQFIRDKLFCTLNIEVIELDQKSYRFKDDENRQRHRPSKSISLNAYAALLEIGHVQSEGNPLLPMEVYYKSKWGMERLANFDGGFFLDTNGCLFGFTQDMSPRWFSSAGINRYKTLNGVLVWDAILPPKTSYWQQRKNSYNTVQNFFVEFQGRIIAMYDTFGEIYEVGRKEVVGQLPASSKGNLPKEKYPKYAEDDSPTLVNYEIHHLAVSENGDFLLCFYKHRDRMILAVMDKNFEVVSKNDLAHLEVVVNYMDQNEFLSNARFYKDRLCFLTRGVNGMEVKMLEIDGLN